MGEFELVDRKNDMDDASTPLLASPAKTRINKNILRLQRHGKRS